MIRSIFEKLNNIKKEKRGVTLYCFSPPIMIATFIIEMLLAIYAFVKSLKHKSDLGIVLALVFLALFQLSEYQICEGSDLLFWARVGLFAITFLPVLGYYLISRLNKDSRLLIIGFFIAIAFATFFTLIPDTIKDVSCGGNYIIFDIESSVHSLYGYYYFGFLLLGIAKAIKGIKADGSKSNIKKALIWFIIGYLSFILPLTAVYIFIPITREAVASIMCGFAVIFAVILTFKIAPLYYECVKDEKKIKDK